MATFSKTGFKALNYNSFRPHYPPQFYQLLKDYVGHPIDKAIDLGCGTGIATYELLNVANQVIGVDLSPSMVKVSNDLIPERCQALGNIDESRIRFEVGNIDDLNVEKLKDCDLITCAQCLHWAKDFEQVFNRVYEVLKPGGTFAYWYYVDPVIVDFVTPSKTYSPQTKYDILTQVRDIYFELTYGKQYLGPYWDPGREVLASGCTKINDHIDKNKFPHVITNKYEVDLNNYLPPKANDLALTKEDISLDDFFNYYQTYSAMHNYTEAKNHDIVGEFRSKLYYLGWNEATTLTLVWNTGYTFIKNEK